MVSKRIQKALEGNSAIRAMFNEGREMAAKYGEENVFDFSLGNPATPAPKALNDAIRDLLDEADAKGAAGSLGIHGYMANAGYEEVRQAIAENLNERFGTKFTAHNLVMTVGAAGGLNIIFKTILDPDDEVIVFAPFFGEYRQYAANFDAKIVIVQPNLETFQPDLADLEAKITARTKALIVNTPNNPTGVIMDRDELQAIANVIRETNIMVLSDEIYNSLTYGPDRHVCFAEIDGMKERTIVVDGFSKSYAMTGWRLGWAMGPKELMRHICKIHQFGIMSAPTTAQFAGIEAIRTGDDDIARMRDQYDLRRRYLLGELRSMGLECFEPEGAFYIFPSIESTGLSSEEFCERLLHEQEVAVIPGSAFGASGEGHIRISYSYSMSHLREACSRMKIFLENLKQEQK